jgi:hypothetical protein
MFNWRSTSTRRLSQILDLIFWDSQLNVYAGKVEVPPTGCAHHWVSGEGLGFDPATLRLTA